EPDLGRRVGVAVRIDEVLAGRGDRGRVCAVAAGQSFEPRSIGAAAVEIRGLRAVAGAAEGNATVPAGRLVDSPNLPFSFGDGLQALAGFVEPVDVLPA